MSEQDPLLASVYIDGAYKPFGELTLAQVEARASELKSASGFGPTVRVGSIARAWYQLAEAMSRAGAATVAELERATACEHARQTWVVPPRGSLL